MGAGPKSTDQAVRRGRHHDDVVVRNFQQIDAYGYECFEVEGTQPRPPGEQRVARSDDSRRPSEGGNVELRGDHNTVLGSRLSQSRSWNLKLASDSTTYDKGGNTAQGTTFSGAATYPIVNKQTGSGPFCGNTIPTPISDPSGKAVTNAPSCSGGVAPTVTTQTPAANATGVVTTSGVTATFSEPVQKVDGTTFTLKAGTTPVGATVTYDGTSRVATLKPNAALAAGTVYTAALTGGASGIKNLTGTPLATVTWNFTTAAAGGPPADTTAPTVTARSPATGATGVAAGADLSVTFSEGGAGVWTPTVELHGLGRAAARCWPVRWRRSGKPRNQLGRPMNPTANLAPGTVYTVTLTGNATTGIRDLANNAVALTTTWTFTTAAAADTVAPTVTARVPATGATGVAVGADLYRSPSARRCKGSSPHDVQAAGRTGTSATDVAATVALRRRRPDRHPEAERRAWPRTPSTRRR